MRINSNDRVGVLPIALGLLALCLAVATVEAGTITYVPITNDADSQIDWTKSYTHAVDFGTGSPGATVNAVPFTRTVIGDLPGIVEYQVTSGSRNEHGGNGNHNVSGDVVNLFTDMIYNGGNAAGGTATLTLHGLQVGQQYDARIYTRQWGAGNRTSVIRYDTNGDGVADDPPITLSQDNATANPPGFAAANQAYALSYQFTADSPELAISFTQQDPNWSWHIYGLSNERLSAVPAVPITNAGFESPTGVASPGYVVPTGWTAAHGGKGVNDASGPFVNGQTIPEGNQVGFLQREDNVTPRTISQTLTGFQVGERYRLQYYEGERGTGGVAHGWATIGGNTVVPGHDVTRQAGFREVFSESFTATAASLDLVLANRGTAGDNTLLLDAVKIVPVAPLEIANGSFEAMTGFNAPGYGAPPGWASSDPGRSGVNDSAGPFVNGQRVPYGTSVALLQREDNATPTTIIQNVWGFEPGKKYTVQYFESERGYNDGTAPVAHGWTTLGGQMVVAPHDRVRRDSSFVRVVSQPFTATADTHQLLLANRGTAGDNTLLIDDVRITRAVPVVANGGFEQPEFGPNGWGYGPAGTSWTFAGSFGVARNGSPWINNGAALEGAQAGYLQGADASIEQVITGLEPGATYNLGWLENRRGGYGGNSYRVLLDGAQVFYSPGDGVNNGWASEMSKSYVAHADTAVLRIESRYAADGLTGDRTAVLDDVHFNFIEDINGRTPLVPSRMAIYNTGIDDDSDTIDDHWRLSSTPGGGPGTAYVDGHPAWAPPTPESDWISPILPASGNTAEGDYLWELAFSLNPGMADTLSLNGRFLADNSVSDVLVNGVSQGITGGGFGTGNWTYFQLNSDFVAGMNTLGFLLNNAGTSANPGGFRAEFLTGFAVVPEPSTFALALVGLLGLGLYGWRRRKG